MDITLLKKAAKQSVALMIGVITLSYAIQHYQSVAIEASKQITGDSTKNYYQPGIDTASESMKQDTIYNNENLKGQSPDSHLVADTKDVIQRMNVDLQTQLSDKFLMIKKPEGDHLTISLTDRYMQRAIEINLNGLTSSVFTSESILRVRGNELYSGEPIYTEISSIEVDKDTGETEEAMVKDFGNDISHRITISTTENKLLKRFSAKVMIELDMVYAYHIYQDEDYYYIDLKKPSDVYDKILVIDAGHGGKDVGAIAKNNQYYE